MVFNDRDYETIKIDTDLGLTRNVIVEIDSRDMRRSGGCDTHAVNVSVFVFQFIGIVVLNLHTFTSKVILNQRLHFEGDSTALIDAH